MTKHVRVASGAIAEILVVPEGFELSDVYPAEMLASIVEAPDEVMEGWVLDGETFVEPEPEPAPEPAPIFIPDVSSAQAKIQLSRASFLAAVKESVTALGGEVEIWFTDARTWQRNNPYVSEVGGVVGLSSSEIDDLFREAAKIDV